MASTQYFLSIPNLLHVIGIFKKSRHTDHHDSHLRRVFFKVMQEIRNVHPHTTDVKQLNKLTLDVADAWLAEEEQDAAVARPPPTFVDPPSASRRQQTTYNGRDFVDPVPPMDPLLKPVVDESPNIETTDMLLAEFQRTRQQSIQSEHVLPPRQENEIAPTPPLDVAQHAQWVCINGADRDVRLYPSRCNFRTKLCDPVRNVTQVRVTFVQVPMESNKNMNNATNTFSHPLDAAFPYILLCVDELRPTYVGSSDVTRRSTAVLTYVRHCVTSNYRGFTTYVPQNEYVDFGDNPLSQLSTITLTLRYPNGELISRAVDDQQIAQVSMMPATNPMASAYGGLLRIVLRNYVDANEYVVNDYVRIGTIDGTPIELGGDDADDAALRRLTQYMTRSEGHVIMGIDTATPFGKIVAVFIKLPGSLNVQTATWTNDVDVTKLFIDTPLVQVNNAPIWNLSMQVALGLQVTTTAPTSKMLRTLQA
jgi:hypothetical protein